MQTKINNKIPELTEINPEVIIKEKESETFERTSGGQDNIGVAIAGLATKNGGILLVGQADLKVGGQVLGLSKNFSTEYTNALASLDPRPLVQMTYFTDKSSGLKLVIIKVQDVGDLRPCSYKDIYYERKGDSTMRLKQSEVRKYLTIYGAPNAEEIPTHAKIGSIDPKELEFYSKNLKRTKETIQESVVAENGYLKVRGVIVLSSIPHEYLEGAFVEIQKYDGFLGNNSVPIGEPIKLSTPARVLIEETTTILQQNMPVKQMYRGARLILTPTVPISVIRETVTNAVAHRNYRSNEHILIRIYSDGFDISNPAVITQEMWKEIQAHRTMYHPNEGIYVFLNSAHLYEGRGEGIWKIREELNKLGMVSPEFTVIGESPSKFYTRISISPSHKKDLKRKKLEEFVTKKNNITTTEVMKNLDVSRVTALKLLNDLVKQGILTHLGYARASKYVVNKPSKEKFIFVDSTQT